VALSPILNFRLYSVIAYCHILQFTTYAQRISSLLSIHQSSGTVFKQRTIIFQLTWTIAAPQQSLTHSALTGTSSWTASSCLPLSSRKLSPTNNCSSSWSYLRPTVSRPCEWSLWSHFYYCRTLQFSCCEASSVTRGRVCNLIIQFAVTLRSKSCHLFLSSLTTHRAMVDVTVQFVYVWIWVIHIVEEYFI
jgi:hypothetical protein